MILPAVLTMRGSAFLLYSVQLPPHTGMQLDMMLSMVVESAHDGWRSFRLLQFAEEVEAPLCFLRH